MQSYLGVEGREELGELGLPQPGLVLVGAGLQLRFLLLDQVVLLINGGMRLATDALQPGDQ